jgi:1-acyl-sn-glycerol-3-phosphate acyltransferase
MPPPTFVRRGVLAPAVVLLTLVVVTALPLLLIGAAALSPLLPGRWRPLRLLWLVTLHLVLESVVLVVLLATWVASGFGWRIRAPFFQRVHYALVRWYLQVLYDEVRRLLRVQVDVEGPPPSGYAGRPLVVLSRHAGPGDSFLVVHALVNWYQREPRIVLKDTLQWDPAIDVLLNRLPNRFIRPGGDGVEAHIAELCRDLDDNDAFVIFPEGGNVTELRRKRAIERLRRAGHIDDAEKAERLRHVMAPKPGGVLAALGAMTPETDVVMVAHTGVEHMSSVLDIWRELPMDRTIAMRWWLVDGGSIPAGRDERIAWLFDWWRRIDDWIEAQQPEVLETPARQRWRQRLPRSSPAGRGPKDPTPAA